jgi:hypothetical protein
MRVAVWLRGVCQYTHRFVLSQVRAFLARVLDMSRCSISAQESIPQDASTAVKPPPDRDQLSANQRFNFSPYPALVLKGGRLNNLLNPENV